MHACIIRYRYSAYTCPPEERIGPRPSEYKDTFAGYELVINPQIHYGDGTFVVWYPDLDQWCDIVDENRELTDIWDAAAWFNDSNWCKDKEGWPA
jgi:hypothetical protein